MKTNLQIMRKRAGFKSARAYAESKGISVNTYTNHEQGTRAMSIADAWQYAEDFHCTLDELVGRVPPSAPTFLDPEQARLNACYENMNSDGKRTLVKLASSMERDIDNRVSYVGENEDYSDAVAV